MNSGVDKKFLNSGELAKSAGVSTDTLRHYERKGVLARPQRGPNGYRQYPASALDRVHLVRRALAVGFTLDELAGILRVRDSGGAPCHEVRALAASKLAQVEIQLSDLAALRDELRTTLKDWDGRLQRKPTGVRANLLESLGSCESNATKSSRRFPSPLKPKKKKEQKSR
ncbi:MAG TPA: heavy metal-responsive transcriptional regulator [Pyrinomonadaceae bacterium]|nr:heavy metal-responsive transcriptional regulator [Pyrinomonadaceae bacterium]